MITSSNDWGLISASSGSELKRHLFKIFQNVSLAINSCAVDDPDILETVPRLADLVYSREELASFRQPLSALARATGLWNYIDRDVADDADLILAETVTAPELDNITLHREQVAALNELLNGKNLILSAPTSFGKSILIDALLASGKYNRVAIVLPTIALLDEFRRRLRKRFRDRFNVVMHANDKSVDGPTVFLGTQERLINRDDLGTLDLTVVDEFYKLDPTRRDERSITLNAAVYRLLARSRQFFFLGPNIDKVQISGDSRWKFEFLRTRFSTVAVDTFDLKDADEKENRLFKEITVKANWPALVFVSAPDKANRLAREASEKIEIEHEGWKFAEWLEKNVGPSMPLVRSVRTGIGLHHGRLPRAIASHMVRMFNEKKLPVLFCTSTLIEGVNTAAKSVLIYDKDIFRADYDFFTFSNIKGRAGRLGQHHVGRVFLFNQPPEQAETHVAPTLFGDEESAPDDYVVHLEDSSPKTDERLAQLMNVAGLDKSELRSVAMVGLNNALKIKSKVDEALQRDSNLVWGGSPKWKDLLSVIELICQVRSPNEFGAFTARQLTFLVSKLRLSDWMSEFLVSYDEKFQGSEDAHDTVFKFLRACEYGLPQYFGVVEIFVKKKYPQVDYSYFMREISRWFRPEELKNLDEEGIPIQISERLYQSGDSRTELLERLEAAARQPNHLLSDFEREWVVKALELDGLFLN